MSSKMLRTGANKRGHMRENVIQTNEVLFLAGGDFKLNGNPLQKFKGIIAAHMEFGVSGNPELMGALIAENGRAQQQQGLGHGQEVTNNRDVRNMIDHNYISGNPTMSGDTDQLVPEPPGQAIPFGAVMESWREVVEQ